MRLKVNKNYIMYTFYKYGEEDNFHYFYYRNRNIFKKNYFYIDIPIDNFYKDEKYPSVERILNEKGILKLNSFIIPEGEYSLKVKDDDSWEIIVNGVILTDLKNLLKNESAMGILEIINDQVNNELFIKMKCTCGNYENINIKDIYGLNNIKNFKIDIKEKIYNNLKTDSYYVNIICNECGKEQKLLKHIID